MACGNGLMLKWRKTMTEECLKCSYATYDCQSYGACRKRWFLDRLERDLEKFLSLFPDRDLEKNKLEEDNGTD